jgi:hypothetical protein
MAENNNNPVPFPSGEVCAWGGFVNYAWSKLDIYVTAALASIMNVDPIEIVILVGRLESLGKLAKMESILRHRKDARYTICRDAKKGLEAVRLVRNAITHGDYNTTTDKGEVIYILSAEFFLRDDAETENKMVVLTRDSFNQHLATVVDIAKKIQQAFDVRPALEKLDIPARVVEGVPPVPKKD